ncbi:hypothetical protein CDAR_69231 [Caerostris darwini]|uniref:Uncharacterized protein n=1 Tax=Caerostris darwini TaxID=1538125 RepID=A0AAV4U0J7_9ARAC|nr:hypothetical protein CDAR_69231 [Caerostris darwini]
MVVHQNKIERVVDQCSFSLRRGPNENPAIYRLLCQDASRMGLATHFDSYERNENTGLHRTMPQCTHFPTFAISSTPVYCRIIYRTSFSYKSRLTPEIIPDSKRNVYEHLGSGVVQQNKMERVGAVFLFSSKGGQMRALQFIVCCVKMIPE